jgi:hypothetical protein
MNIHTVAQNLRNTIAGKEQYLLSIQKERTFVGLRDGEDIALKAVADFLTININELKVILFDVEKCCEKATADSWALNPDRSGGAFTDEEINRGNEWH